MERWVAKVIALIGTFVIPFFCTLLPLKVNDIFLRKGKRGMEILSWLMCFGGGVFFATYILHMAPEAQLIITHSLLIPYNINYPVAEFVMAVGFFLVLYVEQAAVAINRRRQGREKIRKANKKVTLQKSHGMSLPETTENTNCHQISELDGVDAKLMGMPLNTTINDYMDDATPHKMCQDVEIEDFSKQHGHSQDFAHGHSHDFDAHSTRSLVLALALSLHRIFEGMSVGLKMSVAGVFNLFIAVMCHEAPIAFSLGLHFVKNRFTTKTMLVTSFLCSIIMPVGVAIGTVLVEMGGSSPVLDITNGILQSLATGTFIYVTFFEILQGEISHADTSLGKLVSLLLGFALMAALSAVPEETGPEVHPTVSILNVTNSNTTYIPL